MAACTNTYTFCHFSKCSFLRLPFNKRYCLDNWFKEIFDELNILLIPVISEKNLDQIVNICDGLIVTGSPNDVHPKYYGEKPISGKKYIYDEFILVRDAVKTFEKLINRYLEYVQESKK